MAALLREPGYSDHKLVILDIAEPPRFIYDYATKDNLLFVKTDLSNKAGKTRFVNIQGKVFSIQCVYFQALNRAMTRLNRENMVESVIHVAGRGHFGSSNLPSHDM